MEKRFTIRDGVMVLGENRDGVASSAVHSFGLTNTYSEWAQYAAKHPSLSLESYADSSRLLLVRFPSKTGRLANKVFVYLDERLSEDAVQRMLTAVNVSGSLGSVFSAIRGEIERSSPGIPRHISLDFVDMFKANMIKSNIAVSIQNYLQPSNVQPIFMPLPEILPTWAW